MVCFHTWPFPSELVHFAPAQVYPALSHHSCYVVVRTVATRTLGISHFNPSVVKPLFRGMTSPSPLPR